MYNLYQKLKEWGYAPLHLEYWILRHSSGFEVWIKLGRKTKNLGRVRDWFIRPAEYDMKIRNADFLYDIIHEVKQQIEILNKMED